MRKLLFILAGVVLLFSVYKLSGIKFGNDRFEKLPISKTFTVNFEFPDLAREEFSDREKADQAKDWLLFTLISNSGLKQKEIAEASFDLAPVRYGFNNSLANLEYGDTRSKFIGNGEVIALIPVSDEKKRIDNIAHILDETRKNQCEKPKTAFVFEYALNVEGKFAKITRKEDINTETFFTEKMGYFEFPIKSLEDLKAFMDKTDDITYAAQKNGSLIFGGRHVFSQAYGKATPEDVAAIWQSEKYILEKQTAFSGIETRYNEKIDSLNNNFDLMIKTLEFEDGSSFLNLSDDEQEALIKYVSSMIKEDPKSRSIDGASSYATDKNLVKMISQFRKGIETVRERFSSVYNEDASVASASGFSLDPAVNIEASLKFVREHEYDFEMALQPKFTIAQLYKQLDHKNGDLVQYAIAKMQSYSNENLKDEAQRKCMYQRARYDGKLQGTEVGMTLFYTDLLAKMWAANMFNSHPDVNITGFKNLEQTDIISPVVFNEESKVLPNCRLWFGPNKNGFQAGKGKKELIFSRNSTQIFALSHDPTDSNSINEKGVIKDVEVQAAKNFEVVLNWWNNHYEEVGEFESQYQRLNEIMKWSTVIGWINSEFLGSNFYFLDNYTVNYENWFPDWARSKKDLKFNDWDDLTFYELGSVGNKTEAIPLLSSTNNMYSGGVSLAEKSLIKDAPELLSTEKSLFRRANISEGFESPNSFKTFNETNINFIENSSTKTVSIELKPKDGFKLRNRFGEIENNKFEWEIKEAVSGEYSFSSKFKDVPIGELHTTKIGENGFAIGFESQAVDKGMTIAKQSSDYAGDLNDFLRSHPSVNKYFQAEGGEWYVQVNHSEEWMVMKVNPAEAKNSVSLEGTWQARTSGSTLNSKVVEMKWVKANEMDQLVAAKVPKTGKLNDVLDESPEMLKESIIKTNGKEALTTELKKIETKGIAKAEEYAAKGEFKNAAAQTDKLILHFGETKELVSMRARYKLQAGLSELENMNLNTAANYLNDALTSRHASMNSNDFFNEINTWVDKSLITTESKENIIKMGNAYFTDQQMFIKANWEGYKSLAKKVPGNADFTQKGTKIIYADNVAFNNIDPNAPFETVIDEIRSIPGVQFYDISSGGIGRNTRLYATFEPTPGPFAFYETLFGGKMRFRVFPGSPINNCRDDDNDGKCDDEYSVKGPVYYVTAPSMN